MPPLQKRLCPTYKLQLDSYTCVVLKIHPWTVALPSSHFALKLIWMWREDARGILAADITDHKAQVTWQPACNSDQKVALGERISADRYIRGFFWALLLQLNPQLFAAPWARAVCVCLIPFQGFLFHNLYSLCTTGLLDLQIRVSQINTKQF